ncbi:ArsR/SmtB family transcription factor [Terribacillus saccharophilus]|uniref:ArsR/SmtB family transcription factor n=1 Tax=Terribacillus saccharophilus TaxID=361277 RepID=UPI00381F2AEE
MHLSNKLDVRNTTACLKLLSDPTRLMILKLVQEQAYCVCQFVEMFDTSQPAISQHLRKLKNAGMLHEEKRGQWRFFSINDEFDGKDLVISILDQFDENDPVFQTIKKKECPVDCN